MITARALAAQADLGRLGEHVARPARSREAGFGVAASKPGLGAYGRFWRDSSSAVGRSRLSIAARPRDRVSTVSHGRQTSRFGIRRSDAACSIDWCVGPSSPRPIESCVKTWTTRCFISAAMRIALRAVVAEGEEGAAVRDEAAVQGDAVHDRRHAELAHAVVDVAAAPASVSCAMAPSWRSAAAACGWCW